jgi:Meckel syndrome type 1 protein
MTEVPPSQDEFDDADELYRRASALDAGRPSEPVRRAILTHAAELAAARAVTSKAVKRRPVRQAWWRPAAFGTLAAAALAGLLVTPQFITHHPPNTSASLPQSAAKSAPAAPSATTAQNARPAQTAPMEEIVVTEQRAAKAEQRAARTEQYAAQQSSRNASSKPAAQDELQEQASADAQDQRRAANDLNEPSKLAQQSKASDAVVGSAAPPADPAVAQAGAPAAGAGASAALNGIVAGRTAGVLDPAAQLRRAAELGDVPALQALLNKQPVIDARDAGGRTALMLATLRGRTGAVDVLLSSGADPNAADARGTTPLQAALAGNQPAIAEALRRAGAR